jgi:hypothetical protein
MGLLSSGGKKDFDLLNKSSAKFGTKTVTTAGTAVQLSSASIPIPDGFELVVKALGGNSNKVHIALSASDAQTDTNAYEMKAGEAIGLKITDVNLVYVDANASGEGVTWAVEKEA